MFTISPQPRPASWAAQRGRRGILRAGSHGADVWPRRSTSIRAARRRLRPRYRSRCGGALRILTMRSIARPTDSSSVTSILSMAIRYGSGVGSRGGRRGSRGWREVRSACAADALCARRRGPRSGSFGSPWSHRGGAACCRIVCLNTKTGGETCENR
jgi:hypothetical protein